jgi:hypothetical protein
MTALVNVHICLGVSVLVMVMLVLMHLRMPSAYVPYSLDKPLATCPAQSCDMQCFY